MASSVGSYHTDSDGAGNGARTPTHHTNAAAAAASELSPPGSQPQQSRIVTSSTDQGMEAEASQSLEQPVAAWKSKRSQDEYERALEHVVDKDFNLRMLQPAWDLA